MSDTKPFEPINLAQDHYSSPAVGLSTEKGDSWLTVQEKVNAGFKHVYAVIEGGVEHAVEAIDRDARHEIDALREEVTSLQMKLERLVGIAPNAPDPEGKPATGGDPQAGQPTVEIPAPNPVEAKIEGAQGEGTTEGADGFKAPGAGSA